MRYPSSLLLLSIASLFLLGLLMVFGTTSGELLDVHSSRNPHVPLIKQLLSGLFSLILVWFVIKIGYEKLFRMMPALFFFLCLTLALVFVPGIGKQANGSYRWIGVMGATLQPSEFAKFIVPLFLVFQVNRIESMNLKNFILKMIPLGIPLALIWRQPDHGTVVVTVGICIAALFLMRVNMRYWAVPIAVIALFGSVAAYHTPYVAARIHSYLHPEEDLLGKGHQPYQAKIAAGSGGVYGKGPGNSFQKLSYLPEAQNDYIAAIYAEEFGYIGMLVMICLYGVFTLAGFIIASRAHDRTGLALAGLVTFALASQAFLNLGVVSGLLPSTGLNLPFFSQGGSSLLANAFGVGILFDVDFKKV